MILSDRHHDYHCSPCALTGAPCMEGLWLLQRLARAVRAGGDRRLPSGVDLSTATEFCGCARQCNVLVRLTSDRLEVLCGLPDTLDDADPPTAHARIAASLQPPLPEGVPRLRATSGA